jgi:predicted nucleotidyltransferase
MIRFKRRKGVGIIVQDFQDLKKIISPILLDHGIKKAGIFGSYVRNEAKEDSDIDILVEIDADISLLDFVGIKLEIEDKLNKKVDLVEYKTLKPRIKDRILSEEVAIL